MPTTVRTTITIAAPPHAVWAVLTDWPRFPDWNPFMIKLEGETQKVGASPTCTILPPPSSKNSSSSATTTFTPTILTFHPPTHLHWRGRLFGIPGLLTGHHHFVLHPVPEHATRFEHYEEFGGVLVWLLGWLGSDVFERTERGFCGMNEALKGRVEEREGEGEGEGGVRRRL